MSDTNEDLEQNGPVPDEQHCPAIEDEYQQPDSPGTQKLQHLQTTQTTTEDYDVSAKLVERPVSSGSTTFRAFSYGAPPKRDLHIPRKPSTAFCRTPGRELRGESNASPAIGKVMVAAQSDNQASNGRSPLNQMADSIHGRSRPSNIVQDSELCLPNNSTDSQADKSARNQAEQESFTHCESKPQDGGAPKRSLLGDMSRKTTMAHTGDLAPPPVHCRTSFNIAPIPLADPSQHHSHTSTINKTSLSNAETGDALRSSPANTEISAHNEENEFSAETTQVVDLTLNHGQCGQVDLVSQKRIEDSSLTHVDSPRDDGRSSSSELGRRSTETIRRGRQVAERAPANPKMPWQPVRQSKVIRRHTVSQKHQQIPSSLPSGNPAASSGRSPSEEDLYYLLLHRYRKREHTEKQLLARLRQLETENTELCSTAQECQQQLESSIESSSRQAGEIRAQKMIINDIKNSHSKIRNFMTKVCAEQEVLKAKATSIDQDRHELNDDRDRFEQTLESAKTAAASSSNALSKLKTRLARFSQDTAILETSLQDAKVDVQNQQSLLTQERDRSTRYENHISEVTRNHNNFSSTIKQEQQHLLNTLKSIRDKLGKLETHHAHPAQPPNLPALDQCVEMLKGLAKVETASPADVKDMIQVVHGLTESIDKFRKQSEESSQNIATARAQSDGNLSSQITSQLNALVHDNGNEDHISELREAKVSLEERVRANESILMEVRSSKASAEKREDLLRTGTDKLLEEMAKLREMTLTPNKGSGPASELQKLLIKWTSANSLLAESQQRIEVKDQKLQSQDDHIRSLSGLLTEAKAAQLKSTEEIEILGKRLTEIENTASSEQTQSLAYKEQLISNLQEKLTKSKEQYNNLSNDLEQVRSVHDALVKDVEDRNCRLSCLGRDYAAAKSTVANLNQQLVQVDLSREQDARVPKLIHECKIKDAEIDGLNQELEILNTEKQEIDCLRVENKNLAEEKAELHTRLQSAELTSQELTAVHGELTKAKETIQRLNDAHENMSALESELNQKNHRIEQHEVEVAKVGDTVVQLDDLRVEVHRVKDDYESIDKKLKAAEKEAARASVLEQKLSAQESMVMELTAKLAEAEQIARDIPDLQAGMDHFSRTFDDLKHELDAAHRVAEELQSSKAVNVELKRVIRRLQVKAAVADRARNSVTRLGEEIKQNDSRVMAIQEQLHRVGLDSQQQNRVAESETENDLGDYQSQDSRCLLNQSLMREENAVYDESPKIPEKEVAGNAGNGLEARKKKKSANRSSRTLQPCGSTADDQISPRETSDSAGQGPPLCHETSVDDEDRGHAFPVQGLDDTSLVPESQPTGSDPHDMLVGSQPRNMLLGQAISSSPLSDIGEIFDPSESHQAEESHHFKRDVRSKAQMETVEDDDEEGSMRSSEDQGQSKHLEDEHHDSFHIRHGPEQSSRDEQLASSSYGEPLLLDDLEGLGSLPPNNSTDTAHEKRSNSSTQDVLTSPMSPVPRKLPRRSTEAVPAGRPLSRSDAKVMNLFGYGQYVAKDPSPRRLRKREGASQTNTRGLSQGLGDDAGDMRPATPSIPTKERPQPNSAIKRKSEAAELVKGTKPTEKKRAKRNLSNMEVVNRQRTNSQSLCTSTPSRGEQSLKRLRQSSTSTAGSSKSTIVGKNVPAPGIDRRTKKARGGTKSQRYNERFGSQRG